MLHKTCDHSDLVTVWQHISGSEGKIHTNLPSAKLPELHRFCWAWQVPVCFWAPGQVGWNPFMHFLPQHIKDWVPLPTTQNTFVAKNTTEGQTLGTKLRKQRMVVQKDRRENWVPGWAPEPGYLVVFSIQNVVFWLLLSPLAAAVTVAFIEQPGEHFVCNECKTLFPNLCQARVQLITTKGCFEFTNDQQTARSCKVVRISSRQLWNIYIFCFGWSVQKSGQVNY